MGVAPPDYMDCLYHDLHIEGFTNQIHLTTVHPFFMATYSMLTHSVKLVGYAPRVRRGRSSPSRRPVRGCTDLKFSRDLSAP